MRSVHDQIREHALASAGVPSVAWGIGLDPNVAARTNWSHEFEALMRHRLTIGFYRYGPIDPAVTRASFDSVGSAIARLRRYLRDGNQEHLVDAANLCMVEFVIPTGHKRPHLRSSDDGEHSRRL